MPSPKTKSKPMLSMSRPKLDRDAADAFVRGADPATVTAAPKLVEVVADALAPPEASPVTEAPEPEKLSKPRGKRSPKADAVPARGIVTRSSGRQVRRRVVYLPPQVDKKLAVTAATRGVDVSEVVADLLSRCL